MSAKTKIVVLHMKELIYTGIFCLLGILFVVLLLMMFLPDKQEDTIPQDNTSAAVQDNTSATAQDNTSAASQDVVYIPGIYTTELVLGNQTIDVEVIVEKNAISSIRFVNPDEAITTMYPLLEPTLDSICSQIYEGQSLDAVTYNSDSKYTSLVLLEAIQSSLNKAATTK